VENAVSVAEKYAENNTHAMIIAILVAILKNKFLSNCAAFFLSFTVKASRRKAKTQKRHNHTPENLRVRLSLRLHFI
jgi:hypothetical protein